MQMPQTSLEKGFGRGVTFVSPPMESQIDRQVMQKQPVEFRAELFNFFNHAAFNMPQRTVNVTAPRFGVISSAGLAREIQFGMKLEF